MIIHLILVSTGSNFTTGSAVSVQTDGKILYAVTNTTTSKLYRLTDSGSVDLEFTIQTGSYSSGSVFPLYYNIKDDNKQLITSVSQLSNGNVLAMGPAYIEISGSTIVKGWAQVYDSTTGNRIDDPSISC